jgi:uncharacterized repeat protein (TIGR01451 family)
MTRSYVIRGAGNRRRHGLRMAFCLGILAAAPVLFAGQVSAAPFTSPANPGIKIIQSPRHQTATTKFTTSSTATGATNTIVAYGIAHFKITVKNTGNTPLNVTVTDPLAPSCEKHVGELAPGASTTYSCTKQTVTKTFTNIATATGFTPGGKVTRAATSAATGTG